MYRYWCKPCNRLFEDSLAQNRCPRFKCQSYSITEVISPVKGVTYSNFEWTLEDEGNKTDRLRDRRRRNTRNNLYTQYWEKEHGRQEND